MKICFSKRENKKKTKTASNSSRSPWTIPIFSTSFGDEFIIFLSFYCCAYKFPVFRELSWSIIIRNICIDLACSKAARKKNSVYVKRFQLNGHYNNAGFWSSHLLDFTREKIYIKNSLFVIPNCKIFFFSNIICKLFPITPIITWQRINSTFALRVTWKRNIETGFFVGWERKPNLILTHIASVWVLFICFAN